MKTIKVQLMQTRTDNTLMKITKITNAVCLKVDSNEYRVSDFIKESEVEALIKQPNIEITVSPFDR